MTILPAGLFKASYYRKAIPDWVKIVCAIRALNNLDYLKRPYPTTLIKWVRSLRFDHRPPLQDRSYDTEKGDFIPPQNDPDHIEAIPAKEHDERTFGRKADAEKTVTTKGSDAHNRASARRIRDAEQLHRARMAIKVGDPVAVAKLLHVEKPKTKPKRQWPKSKIPSRPFPKKQRSLSRRRA